MTSAERAVDITVTGLVQGVFFRARCAERAADLGVTGWIGNQPDGSVAGHFEGGADAVDALVEWCRTGPRRARVEDVRVTDGTVAGAVDFRTT